MVEKTLVILKPDAVKRKLIGEILARFEKKNLQFLQMKLETIERSVAEVHYAHIQHISIYKDMIDFITSGPSLMVVLEGENAIKVVRGMIGKTSCFESLPGTIRGDYSIHSYENIIHASDTIESAEIEINRFFK